MQMVWRQKYTACAAMGTVYAQLPYVVLAVRKRVPNDHLNCAYPNGQT